MSSGWAFRALAHVTFATLLVIATMPVGTHESEARGFRVRRAIAADTRADDSRQQDGKPNDSAADAIPATTTATASQGGQLAAVEARPQSTVPAKAGTSPGLVPGCAEGMVCTVCLAGCPGPVDGITYAGQDNQSAIKP